MKIKNVKPEHIEEFIDIADEIIWQIRELRRKLKRIKHEASTQEIEKES